MNDVKIDRLLTAVAQGQSDALEQLYALTKNGVYAFIYPYFNNRANAEDCLHDVFIKVFERASGYQRGTNGRAWLLQIAKNTALDCLKKGRRVDYVDNFPDVAVSPPVDTPVFDAINQALDEEERQIVIFHVLWGYKHREIAQRLGLPTGTVTSKYKRALQKLKRYIKEVQS